MILIIKSNILAYYNIVYNASRQIADMAFVLGFGSSDLGRINDYLPKSLMMKSRLIDSNDAIAFLIALRLNQITHNKCSCTRGPKKPIAAQAGCPKAISLCLKCSFQRVLLRAIRKLQSLYALTAGLSRL